MEGSVREWYRGQKVLITGGTGYLGKVLLEKILWSCPEVGTVYLLIRNKKDLSIQQRLQQLFKSRAFDRLNKKYPERLSKVVAVHGDISMDGLGLAEEDRNLLVRDITVLFHGAASVRFDDSLEEATCSNLIGTKRVLEFAKKMPYLQRLVMVSTAYTNCDRIHIEERIYPAKMAWRDLLQVIEKVDKTTVSVITNKLLGVMPNTYVFSKSLMEHMLCELGIDMPMVICRPSVVYTAIKEPEPGWTDNMYGPFGLSFATMVGANKACLSHPTVSINYIPCDYVANALILAAATYSRKSEEVQIINICLKNSVPTEKMFGTLAELSSERHLKLNLQPVISFFTQDPFIFNLVSFCTTTFPAMIFDSVLYLLGKKTMLLKTRRKVYQAWKALSHFSCNQFQFGVANCESLLSRIEPDEEEEFGFQLDHFPDLLNTCRALVELAQETLVRPLYANVSKTRIIFKLMYYLDMSSVIGICSGIIYVLLYLKTPQRLISCLSSFFFDEL